MRCGKSTALVTTLLLLVACNRGEPTRAQEVTPAKPAAYTGDTLPTPEAQGQPAVGGVLRVAMEAEPPSLNPQLDPLDGWGRNISGYVYESLARPDARTWKHEPRLAERWEIAEDKLHFTFYLRRGVRWHDGHVFNADDVVFTFDKLVDPRAKTFAMRSFLEPLEKVEKLDAFTVRFTMKKPYWFAFEAITGMYIYPRHLYASGDFNTHPQNRAPIGTGPFKFLHWKTGEEIALERHGGYWGTKANLAKLVFKWVPDATVRTQMVRRGELDVVERLPPEHWQKLAEDPEVASAYWRLRHIPDALQWIGWNEDRPQFKDARVRRALTMLVDRDDIVQNLRLGLDVPAASWFYPGSPEHNTQLKPLPYDPTAAIRLLEQAGWRDTNDDGIRDKGGVELRFTLLYPAAPSFYEQLAGLMQHDFQRAGIGVDTSRLEWAVYTERLRKHEFDACALLWKLEPRSDPWQIWHSSSIDGSQNWIGFRNAEVDRLLEQARAEFDEERRVKLYHRFSEILAEEQPYTMLFNRYNLSLVSKRFGGIRPTPYAVFPYDELYQKPTAPPGAQ